MPRAPAPIVARFTEMLAEHVDEADIQAGRGRILDPGGDVLKVSDALGISASDGNQIFQRIRRRLGRQAN